MIVGGILWGFVVVKIKIICFGGFFKVFKSVLNVFIESMWILLIMYILYFIVFGVYFILFLIFWILFILLFEVVLIFNIFEMDFCVIFK